MPQAGDRFNPHKLFVGSFIPNALMRCPDISATAKLLWARLAQYAGRDGKAWPKQATLAEEIGITGRQVRNLLAELMNFGLLLVEAPNGADRLAHKSARYYFLWHSIFDDGAETDVPERKPMSGPERKCASAPEQKPISAPQKENHKKENQEKDIPVARELATGTLEKQPKKQPKKKPAKPPDPRIDQFLTAFLTAYDKEYGKDYVIFRGRDHKLVQTMLAGLGPKPGAVQTLLVAARAMFKDPWWRNRADIPVLAQRLNQWLPVDSGLSPGERHVKENELGLRNEAALKGVPWPEYRADIIAQIDEQEEEKP